MSQEERIDVDAGFWTVHRGLPREGPGSTASTEQALALTGVEGTASVVDVGCGPGAQTMVLAAALPRARIVGVDAHDRELAVFDGGGADAVGYAFMVLRRDG